MPITNGVVSASEVMAFIRFQPQIGASYQGWENKPFKILNRTETPTPYLPGPSQIVRSLLGWRNKPKRTYVWDGSGTTRDMSYEKTFNATETYVTPSDPDLTPYWTYITQIGQFTENYDASTVFNQPFNALSVRLGAKGDGSAFGRITAYFTNLPIGSYKIASYLRVKDFANYSIYRFTPAGVTYANEQITTTGDYERFVTFTLSTVSTVTFDLITAQNSYQTNIWDMTIIRSA